MTATTIRVQMAQRKDTAANWTAANPILLSGEIGYETDTEKFKIGDGTTNWNSLAYLPIPDGSGNLTITGNLEIGSTGSLTFEGSTADGFETTLAVTDPTADRTITLPDVSGTVVTTGDTGSVTSTMIADGTIVDADVSATAEIAVSKLANGTANQVIVTDGTNVSWSDDLTLAGNLTVNGTTTTVNTQTLVVEDKNIELGVVGTPTDLTADGGGITLKGSTDKTINWIDATDSWTSSEHVDLASGKSYRINGTEVLSGTTLGSGVTGSSLTSVGTLGSLTVTGDATAGTFIPTSGTAPTNGIYLPAANSVGISTNSVGRLFVAADGTVSVKGAGTAAFSVNGGAPNNSLVVDSSGRVGLGTTSPSQLLHLSQSGTGEFTSIRFANTGASGRSYDLGLGGNTTVLPGSFYVFDNTASATRFLIDSSGRVGVGTTSPSSLIDLSAGYASITWNNDDWRLRFRRTDGSFTGGIKHNGFGDMSFWTSDNERARIDSSGRLLVGTSSASFVGTGIIPSIQLESTSDGTSCFSVKNNQASAGGSSIVLAKSRGTSVNSHTAVQSNDIIGLIRFAGADGTDTQSEAASVKAEVDGTPGANDMPGRLVFSTTADGASSPTERMRISSDGNMLVGQQTTSTPGRGNTVVGCSIRPVGTAYFSVSNELALALNRNTADGAVASFFREGVNVGSISVTTTATAYNTSSDYRLKENITAVTDGITRLQQLKPSRFNFIADPTKTVDGFLAHEVQTVVPEAITGEKDAVDENGDPQYQGIDQSKIVPLLTAALQEAVAKIESLEARLTAAGI